MSYSDTQMKIKKNRAIPKEDLCSFANDAALLIHAGIPLYQGLPTLYRDLPDGTLKSALIALEQSLVSGMPMAKAFEQTNAFPRYFVEMIAIGENSGRTDDVFAQLGKYYSRLAAFSDRLRSAIVYPMLLILMMTVVIGVLIVSVLPIFSDILLQFSGEMTQGAASTLSVGFTVSIVIFVLMSIVLMLFLIGFLLCRTERGQQKLTRIFNAFFLTKKLGYKIAAGKFSSALSMMLKSGLSPQQALQMSQKVAEHTELEQKIAQLLNALEQEQSLEQAFDDAHIFDGMGEKLLHIGLKTGTFDACMEKLAQYYEEEVDDSVASAISVVEPSLVAVLAVVIGAVMLSAMLPLISIVSSIG